ncbi:unnamed protein product [Ectocarpus fasciculatus]
MSKTITQPRNRHIVAVIALLISSVEGFVPHARQTHRHHNYSNTAASCSSTTAVAAAAWSSAQQQTSTRQRGTWDGVGARRRSGALCQERWGFGHGEGEGEGLAAAVERARKLFPLAGGAAGSLAAAQPSSLSSRGYRRGSSSLSMALHFPKPPKLPKPPPPGDKAPGGGGGGKSGSAGSTSSSSHPHESRKQQHTATTAGGLLPQPAAGKSGGGDAASGGVSGVSDLDEKEGKGSAGQANGTKTDLNGSKTIRRRRINGSSTPSSRAGAPGTSPPPKRRTGVTPTSSRSGVVGKKRKLRRPRSGPGSVAAGSGGRGVQAVVVKGDMELAEISEMMSLVLERLSETERELKRIQKEGALAKTNRSEVRDRKFIIDTRAKMLGAAFAGSVAGMIVGWSVLPNLWLVGGVTGALAFAALSRSSTGTVGTICSTCGIQVALMYKDVRDWWEQTVFLYKTGKLSYTYWRGFERYDQAWGLSAKYTETVAKVSKEALELDRQYKIRQKTLRAGKRLTRISRQVGSSAKREVTTLAGTASDWGGNKLRKWGLMGDDLDPRRKRTKLTELLKLKKNGAGRGGAGGAKRPLGVSMVLDGMFGERSRSMYSAPPAGGARIKIHKADPIIPARIRHVFMTKKQIRDERLQKYRVGFMGMRVPRSFDKDD